MTPQREPLFVYGTLRPNAEDAVPQAKALEVLLPAETDGVLFDLGDVPGAVFGGGGIVHGDVVLVTSAQLADLDAYEGAAYRRERVTVRTSKGTMVCWAFALNEVPPHAERVPSGDYAAHRV